MNERIKELIKQCTSWSDGSTWTSHEVFDKEKFAELIVKEHIDILRQSWYDLNNLPEVSDESPRDIGIRVGRKAEINALIEKFHKHWSIER